jgi:hypothetical protein
MIAYCLLTLLNIVSLAVAFNNYWVVGTGFFFFLNIFRVMLIGIID